MHIRRALAAVVLTTALGVGAIAAPTPAGAVTITTGENYVSIGDSFAAGAVPWYALPIQTAAWAFNQWANSGYSSWAHICGRATNNPWSYQVRTAITSSGTPTLRNASCSGATTAHITGSQTADTYINGIQTINSPQRNQINAGTKAVTVSLGGNDAQLLQLILSCRQYSCAGSTGAWSNILGTGAGTVQTKLDTAYDAIEAVQPAGAKVVVVQYPAFVPDETLAPGSGSACNAAYTIDSAEAAYIAQVQRDLNQAIATAAAGRTGWSVVDMYTPSQAGPRHDMCSGSANKWITGIDAGETATVGYTYGGSGQVYPMHLNDAGHTAYATTVGAAVLAA